MKQLRNNIGYEWMLLIRNKFLLIPFVLNVLVWTVILFDQSRTGTSLVTVEGLFYSSFLWLLLLNLFLIGVVAIYIANRDYTNTFEQVALTYPIQNWQWLTGKWIVVQLYGLILTCMTICIQLIWFISSKIGPLDVLKQMVYVFVQMEGALFLMISFGFLFARLIRNVLAYITIPALLIVSLLLPMDSVGQSLVYDNPLLHLLTFFDHLFVNTPYEGMWGIHRVFTHTLVHQMAVVAVGILIFCIVLWLFKKQRRSKSEGKSLLPITIAFAIIGIGLFTGQLLDYQKKLNHFVTTGKLYMKEDTRIHEDEDNAYYNEKLDDIDHIDHHLSMEQSDLQVNLKTNHELEAMNVFTVKNNQSTAVDEIQLTLNRQLTIDECVAENVKACNREGDFITIQLTEALESGEETEVMLSYSGSILRYYDEGKNEGAFIQKNRVYLPKSAGWYPLIGHRPLLIAMENELNHVGFSIRSPHLVESAPTNFTVHIESGDIHVPLALPIREVSKGKYEGTTAHGLDLIGGDLQEKNIGGVRVIHNPQIERNIAPLIGMHNDVWKVTKDWLALDLQPETIYVLPRNQYYWLDETATKDFYLLRENDYKMTYEDIIWALIYPIFLEHNSFDDELQYYDFRLLEEMLSWGIHAQIDETIPFMEITEDDLEHMDSIYLEKIQAMKQIEEKDKAAFLSLIQYIYQQWTELENKQDFNLDQLIEQYEEGAGI